MQGQHRQQQQQGSGYPPAYNMPPNQNYAAPQMQLYSHPAPTFSTVGAPVMYQAQQQPQPQPPPGPHPPQQMSMPQQRQPPPLNMQSSPRGKSPQRDGDRPNGRQAKQERGDGDRGGDNKRQRDYQPPLAKSTCELLSFVSRLYVRRDVTAERRKRLRELTEIFLQPADHGMVNRLIASQSFTWFTHEDRETTLEGLLSLCEDLIAVGEA